MYKPLATKGAVVDALLLRRYKPPGRGIGKLSAPWRVPDDRKVNPWDKNEPDPTDKGTMGTIPGPVIECDVGDKIVVHFRNHDMRTKAGSKDLLDAKVRTHSLHPHGLAFLAAHDGAYPLSPADKSQPVGAEAADWLALGVKDFKKGDRVPPGCTFDYTWIAGAPSEDDPDTIEPWPTTAGVWLYHDHSICDMENVNLGAIGLIVVHNPDDPQDVDVRKPASPTQLDPDFLPDGSATGPVTTPVELGKPSRRAAYFPPPTKAQYLQLFHQLTGAGTAMLVNGRQYLGNTPTLIAGPETLMRFGVVGMGSDFHTFHIHGHRWVVPGPDGSDADAIQNSAQVRAVSQFEDTRTFGPANSFSFTIQEGSFFGARDDDPTGEFHMHCHVLMHMDMGMMGSLLVIPKSGVFTTKLAEGEPCPDDMPADAGKKTIAVKFPAFTPDTIDVTSGTELTFDFQEDGHTVMTVSHTTPDPITITMDPGGDPAQFDQTVPTGQRTVMIMGSPGQSVHYRCGIHSQMTGVINVV